MAQEFELDFTVNGDTVFDQAFWNRFVQGLGARFAALEAIKVDWDVVSQQGLAVALQRINDALLPSAQRIRNIAELGFLVASSDTENTLANGAVLSFVIVEGETRELFTPSPFLILGRRLSADDYGVAKLRSYDNDTGVLDVEVVTFAGDPGPHSDWSIGALAGSTLAQLLLLDQGEDAQAAAEGSAEEAAASAAAAAASKAAAAASAAAAADKAQAAAGSAQSASEAATAAEAAQAAAEQALPQNFVRKDIADQGLTAQEQANARGNIGLDQVENKSSGAIRGELTAEDVGAALDFTPAAAGFRNLFINGHPEIDQRLAGASVTPTASRCIVDRWVYDMSQPSKMTLGQNLNAVAPPAGQDFTRYLGAQTTVAYVPGAAEVFNLRQTIEGRNIARLMWGTANAKSITLSFWVYSSLTGTFGGCLRNGANTRSYPFTYDIVAANAWTKEVLTVPGDTAGVWATDNGAGIHVMFGLGCGANQSGPPGAWMAGSYVSATGAVSVVSTAGATFYLTGVQFEEGSVASPFEHRPRWIELALCERYFETNFDDGVAPKNGSVLCDYAGTNYDTTHGILTVQFKTRKRGTNYSVGFYSPQGHNNTNVGAWSYLTTGWNTAGAGCSVVDPGTLGMGVVVPLPIQSAANLGLLFSGGWHVDNEI